MNCAKVLEHLDRFSDRELQSAEAAEIADHLRSCPQCAAVLANRTALRDRLRGLARGVATPERLAGQIGNQIRNGDTQTHARRGFLAAAAAVVLTAGTYISWKASHSGARTGSQEDYIASVTPGVAPVMRIGLQQHIHCAVFRSYPDQAPDPKDLAASLGPQCAGLVPVLQEHVPAGYRAVLAHQCHYKDRRYIHVVARRGDGDLISLLVTKRGGGEAFENDLRAVVGGGKVYSAGGSPYSMAGFETPEYLVYVVSDLGEARNRDLIDLMEPGVRGSLAPSAI